MDPEIVGPGIWFVFHSIAIECDLTLDFNFFSKVITTIIYSLKCKKCKKHAIQYITRNDPYKQINRKFLPSKYINIFHNTVNIFLKKPIYSITESRKQYNQECKSCGDLKLEIKNTNVDKIISKPKEIISDEVSYINF
uniref:Sulfhydryl oxidase n=1 Tax=Pithovirus LCPAC001 TaxID=2506585 RepID=A0A481Z2W2_9VIRU|nr:MAG: Erv1/Alr family disulfide (thiol) oxidoreductase [Pithovirus LCPAC001]